MVKRKVIGFFRKNVRIIPKFAKKGKLTKAYKKKLKNEAKEAPKKISERDERIRAINAVKKHVKGRSEKIGWGSDVDVYQPWPGFGDKIIKQPIARQDLAPATRNRFRNRFLQSEYLNRKGLAPKSHLIELKKRSFIVQDKIKGKLPEMDNDFAEKLIKSGDHGSMTKEIKRRRGLWKEFEDRMAKVGAWHGDATEDNVGVVKGKLISIDSGDVELVTSKAKRQAEQLRKLIIKKRKKK